MYQSSPGVLLNQNMYHLWGRADGAEFIGNKQTDTQLYNTLIHRPTSVFLPRSAAGTPAVLIPRLLACKRTGPVGRITHARSVQWQWIMVRIRI